MLTEEEALYEVITKLWNMHFSFEKHVQPGDVKCLDTRDFTSVKYS